MSKWPDIKEECYIHHWSFKKRGESQYLPCYSQISHQFCMLELYSNQACSICWNMDEGCHVERKICEEKEQKGEKEKVWFAILSNNSCDLVGDIWKAFAKLTYPGFSAGMIYCSCVRCLSSPAQVIFLYVRNGFTPLCNILIINWCVVLSVWSMFMLQSKVTLST